MQTQEGGYLRRRRLLADPISRLAHTRSSTLPRPATTCDETMSPQNMSKIAMKSITPSSIYENVWNAFVRFGFSERFLEACMGMALFCFFPVFWVFCFWLDDNVCKQWKKRERAKLKSCLKRKYKVYRWKNMSPDPERNRRVAFSPELPELQHALRDNKIMQKFKKKLEEVFDVKLNTRVAPVPPGKTQGQYLTHDKFIQLLTKELRERKIHRYHSAELWDMFIEFAANH
jgi:hypothetical protein